MISIIIPTLNEEKIIGETLGKIRREFKEYDYELIVSDDGSNDRTVETAQRFADTVLVRKPDEIKSIAAGRNRGARAARGEFFLFIDADVEIRQINEAMARAQSLFAAHPDLAALTGAIRVRPEAETFGDRIVFSALNRFHRLMNNMLCMGVAAGEFQMIRRGAFEKLGGYNETLVASEDYELFRRLSQIGKTLMDPRIVIWHDGRRAHAIGWPRLLWQWFKNTWSVLLFKRSHSKNWETIR